MIMARSKTRFDKICTVCGKHYEYCHTCSRFSHMERWHDAYCSYNCKELYNITAGFINGWQTPEVEAARLAKLDLSYKDKLPQWMQDTIKDIKKVDTSAAEAINDALKVDVKENAAPVAKDDTAEASEDNTSKKIEPEKLATKDSEPENQKTESKPQQSSIPKEFKKVDYSQKNKPKNDYKK